MAKARKEFEVIDEFGDIAQQIINMYPETFYDTDVSLIRCYGITNKPKTEKDKMFEVKAIGMPIRMDCPFGWYCTLNSQHWAELSDAHKHLLVAFMMWACGNEEGKVRQFDYKDFDIFLSTDGIGPHAFERGDVVDILQTKVDFKQFSS